ncbi:MAG: prenyltransferase/squalene oxidase repeat-containing protein [Proteocatella sp.]
MKSLKKLIALVLATALILTSGMVSYAYTPGEIDSKINDTASYIIKNVQEPALGSIGGEWAVIGLARGKAKVPDKYYEKYYKGIEEHVKQNKGILHKKKYTDYSRVILALTAIGKNPENVAGYNLLENLGDFEKTVWQGINGPVFALIALDSNNYKIPENKTAKIQATRELYIKDILKRQLSDGGFALTGDKADTDITAMALQALSKYQSNKEVKVATTKALDCLSKLQKSNGGYDSWGTENLESTAQVATALCELGIDVNDKRFVKNGNTLIDNMLTYYTKNGFIHTKDGSGNSGMATEQALYTLVNYQRISKGQLSLYRMTDVKTNSIK